MNQASRSPHRRFVLALLAALDRVLPEPALEVVMVVLGRLCRLQVGDSGSVPGGLVQERRHRSDATTGVRHINVVNGFGSGRTREPTTVYTVRNQSRAPSSPRSVASKTPG